MDDRSTSDEWYTDRLRERSGARWKKLVPNPYRRNISKLRLGRVLDIGCGIGRCLGFNHGNGIGIDHNLASVEICRGLGFEAYTPDDFAVQPRGTFDSLLLSHVLEHMSESEGLAMLKSYVPFLRDGGRVILITPQLAGQRSDPTHVRYVGQIEAARLLADLGATAIETRSHPFPAFVGKLFRHNENIAIGTVRKNPAASD